MKEQVGTIDLKPAPEDYAKELIAIIFSDSTSAKDKRWASGEIQNAFRAAARRNPDVWGGEPPAPTPNTEIVTAKGLGTVEKIGEIQIPNLWGIATLFSDAAAIAKKAEDYHNEHHIDENYIPNEKAKIAIPSSVEAERIATDILKTWHLAHSMRDHIIAH